MPFQWHIQFNLDFASRFALNVSLFALCLLLFTNINKQIFMIIAVELLQLSEFLLKFIKIG